MTIELIISKSEIESRSQYSAVAHYLLPFLERSQNAIANVDTKVGLLRWGEQDIPLSIDEYKPNNSYVCSPYTAYIPYAMQEVSLLENRTLFWLGQKLLPKIGWWLKLRHVDKNIHVNNWLLSTNLYPEGLELNEIPQLLQLLIGSFPAHGIILRSLNRHSNQELMSKLGQCGFIFIPSRQIYINDLTLKDYCKKVDIKRDIKLLESSSYQLVPQEKLVNETDRIVDLYNQLYLNKYSIFNPQFNIQLIKNMMSNPYFTLQGLRNENGRLDAVGGYYQIDKTMTMPVVGYEMSQPQSEGLYRQIVISAMKNAMDNNMVLNASSGAPAFKRSRGAIPFIEYSAVYVKHLAKPRQRMWFLLREILERFAVPMMKKHQL